MLENINLTTHQDQTLVDIGEFDDPRSDRCVVAEAGV
jgi:hypothetical protein